MMQSEEDRNERVEYAAEEIREERNSGRAVNGIIGSRTQRKPTNIKLTPEQKDALKTYLLRLKEIGSPAKVDHIRSCANLILEKAYAGDEDPPLTPVRSRISTNGSASKTCSATRSTTSKSPLPSSSPIAPKQATLGKDTVTEKGKRKGQEIVVETAWFPRGVRNGGRLRMELGLNRMEYQSWGF